MQDDLKNTFSNLNPKDMTKSDLEELIQKVKKETYEQTIEYLEMNGYIDPLGAWAQMSYFKEANYNAQEAFDKKQAFYESLESKPQSYFDALAKKNFPDYFK